MAKKIGLIIGFLCTVVLLGNGLQLVTQNSLIANLGAIVITSFFMGSIWLSVTKEEKDTKYLIIIPSALVVFKLLTYLLAVKTPSLQAIVLFPIIYYLVSWYFLKFGVRTNERRKARRENL